MIRGLHMQLCEQPRSTDLGISRCAGSVEFSQQALVATSSESSQIKADHLPIQSRGFSAFQGTHHGAAGVDSIANGAHDHGRCAGIQPCKTSGQPSAAASSCQGEVAALQGAPAQAPPDLSCVVVRRCPMAAQCARYACPTG